MITLKEKHKRDEAIIQEVIRDSDLDKLDATYRQIDDMLDGLSPEGRQALAPIDQAIEKAQQSIQKVASASGNLATLDNLKASRTISNLVLLQSTLVQVFQQMPKIMNVVKRGLSKHLTRGPYEGVKESVTLRGNYLTENYQNMPLREVLLLLEKKREEESPLSQKGISIRRLADELHITKDEVMEVMRELGMDTGIGGRSAIQPEDAQRIFVALTSADPQTGEEPEVEIEDPQKRQALGQKIVKMAVAGEEEAAPEAEPGEPGEPDKPDEGETEPEEKMGPDSPIKDLLGDAAERAHALIKSSMRPKGFFAGLSSALGGDLPFGVTSDSLATGILALPFKDFTRLVDNAAAIKIQMDSDAAKEVAATTEKGTEGAEAASAATRGGKVSISKLGGAMDKRGLRGTTKNTVMDFFRTLVGKGPIEFSE